MVLVPTILIYMTGVLFVRNDPERSFIYFTLAVAFFYIPYSLLLLIDVLKRPGAKVLRRSLSLLHDYSGITFGMSVGGQYTLPVFAVLLWVTVGYGVRYGSRYLLVASICALASLAVTLVNNTYWQENLLLVLTLTLTTILVPTYLFSLLSEIHRSHRLAMEASAAKSRFLAQASHDLRQPIHAISLFTACLRDAGLLPGQRQLVENIDRSLQSVSGLFRSLLDISTLDSGKVVLRSEIASMHDLVGHILQQNSQGADWAGVELRSVDCRLHVFTDPTMLTTMLQNILTNAFKYAPGRPVLIGCRRRGGNLDIEIHDRGKGISSEHLDQVFDEFYQVRERGDRDIEGVGLGLSIVRRMAYLMGLTVEIQSREKHGTTVVIGGLTITEPPSPVPMANRTSVGSVLEGLRVLLIEDNTDVLSATAALLQRWGCIVQAETSPPLTSVSCDVILTDYDLGYGTTGADSIRQVRAAAGRNIPAIVMTGHDENRIREDMGEYAIPILCKPVRPAELRSTLASVRVRNRQERSNGMAVRT
ncbi:response regulator [Rhizobiales bacterium RZME27]|uniref:histidine kinase n=2 Tax=Endobacterium cereale TaxID=2663029 RepID=A0A6A8AA60_9HYPH|nr:response regulator [Endobacterium cereale]